jgi:site-specific DNA-methyltransferase (adenine-specific)
MGSFPYPRNGILKLDYEFILIFKKYGKAPKVDKERKEKSIMTTEEWNQYFSGHWNFSGERQDKHLAMFPVELPKRLIKMFSFVGDTILDPFLGSGTTSLAAKQLDRNSVGYEINDEFLPIIEKKLKIREKTFFNNVEFEIVRQENAKFDFEERVKLLPYLFVDTVKLDRKIDPKKLQFGSKVDKNSSQRTDFYSVKRIVSPNEIILDSDIKIKLLGVKQIDSKKEEAIQFLHEKTRGQKVFLRFDEKKYDDKNNLLCYLYLKNKTFINVHLIKAGLASVDNGHKYKYYQRFKKYWKELNG